MKDFRARGRCCSACLAGFVWEAALLSLPDVSDLHCAYDAPVEQTQLLLLRLLLRPHYHGQGKMLGQSVSTDSQDKLSTESLIT